MITNCIEETIEDVIKRLDKLVRYDLLWDCMEEEKQGDYIKYNDVLQMLKDKMYE